MKKTEKWNIFKCKSGAEYQWNYDDKCIAVKVGKNTIWLELQALQFFMSELSINPSQTQK